MQHLKKRSRRRGQALTEFAIVAPLLFLIMFGIIQLGFMLGGQNGLTNAAREAARYASTLPTPDTTVAGDCSAISTNAGLVYDRLRNINMLQYVPGYKAGNVVLTGGLAACGASAAAGTGTGVQYCKQLAEGSTYAIFVRVTVLYRHPLFIPLVGRFFGSSNTWTGSATEFMRVEGPNRSAASSAGFATC
jgi:Flp pilus assembly protein TadG